MGARTRPRPGLASGQKAASLGGCRQSVTGLAGDLQRPDALALVKDLGGDDDLVWAVLGHEPL